MYSFSVTSSQPKFTESKVMEVDADTKCDGNEEQMPHKVWYWNGFFFFFGGGGGGGVESWSW